MVDAIEVLAVAAAGLLGVISATGWYLLRRLKKLEREDEESERKVRRERDDLRRQVADLGEQVRLLRVKADRVDSLQTQIEAMGRSLKETQDRLDASEERSNNLQTANEQLTQSNAELQTRLAQIEIERDTYKDALRLVGGERIKSEPEASAQESEDSAPEKQESREDGP